MGRSVFLYKKFTYKLQKEIHNMNTLDLGTDEITELITGAPYISLFYAIDYLPADFLENYDLSILNFPN
jgi:hypothetical protein